ncbi:hypothetical protein P692DRAFT_20850913 [Suillus brevipes Sb2]|nr:hypothetical protein P692DRAFT_20850913 [Suillus brevipes Sb2]
MIVDPSRAFEPGEVHVRPVAPPRHGHPGGGGGRRNWRRGRSRPPHQREVSSDAMGAFTRFFKAEAQASKHRSRRFTTPPKCSRPRFYLEELAVRKEAHAFAQLLKAEREAAASRFHTRSRHLTLDNRSSNHHPSAWPVSKRHRIPGSVGTHHSQPAPMAAPSTTAAQLIADVANNATAILQSPPTPAPPTPDNGPDVDDIIAAAEQMDLEQAARHSGLTPLARITRRKPSASSYHPKYSSV